MSKIEVDQITQQSGTTLTVGGGACKTATVDATTVNLGRSGGTVSLVSGATQSGFGRTGTVDWQTTKKTANFTAANGEGYFVDTGGGAITATLPASPSAGNIVYIKDYDGNFATAACTVARNGSNIRGEASDFALEKDNAGAAFIYVDATEGWQVFVDGSDPDAQAGFITATGGTITTSGNCKIHTFTGPGTFSVSQAACAPANNVVSYLVVAGGGGGSAGSGPDGGGGGGAGGFREYKSPVTPYTASPLDGNPSGTAVTVTATSFPITVGGGGPGGPFGGNAATSGSNSVFSTITSTGGGFGAPGNGGSSSPQSPIRRGAPGGSGGGGGGGSACSGGAGGSGNTPPVTPAQGTDGGHGYTGAPPDRQTGGGGGATAAGGNSGSNSSGAGGAGATTNITASPVAYAGGGGGGAGNPGLPSPSTGSPGAGGTGGGGAGAAMLSPTPGVSGTDNTGGGGGGGNGPANGGNGGSGVVIIRYKFQ